MTSQSKARSPDTRDRVLARWTRPREFRPGWTRGLSIRIPYTEMANPFLRRAQPDDVRYGALPPPGHWATYTVVYKDIASEDWSVILRESEELVGTVFKKTGEVGVLRWVEPIPPDELPEIEKIVTTMVVHYPQSAKTVAADEIEASGFIVSKDKPELIEVPLSMSNLAYDGPATP